MKIIFALNLFLSLNAAADGVVCERNVDSVLANQGLGTYWHPKHNKTSKGDEVTFSNNKSRVSVHPGSSTNNGNVTVVNSDSAKPVDHYSLIFRKGSCELESFSCSPRSASQFKAVSMNVDECSRNTLKAEASNPCVVQIRHLCEQFKTQIAAIGRGGNSLKPLVSPPAITRKAN